MAEEMSLEELISSNPDPRELKRALTVQMRIKGLKHREIEAIVGVPSSYISRWEKEYRQKGVIGLRLGYQGSQGYLSQEERENVVKWIQEKPQRNLSEVIDYVEEQYGLMYGSMQSYYQLLKDAGMSWQKGQKKIPVMMHQWRKPRIKSLQIG